MGSGFRTFQSGEVLTSSNVQNFLMDQSVMVFAGAAARGSAITSPEAGMVAYRTDGTADSGREGFDFYNGTSWVRMVPQSGVLQVKSTTKTDTFTMASSTFADITGLSVSITPTRTSSQILIIATVNLVGLNASSTAQLRFVRDSTAIALGDAAGNRTRVTAGMVAQDNSTMIPGAASFLDSPASTSALSYKVQIRSDGSNTVYVNRTQFDADTAAYTRGVSTITVMEVAP